MNKKRRAPGEGTVRKRKDGTWEWRSPPSCPVKKSLYARTQREVLEKAKEFLKDLDAGIDVVEVRKLTVADFLDRWLRDSVKGSVWHTTYRDHERDCRLHIKPKIGHLKLKDLSKMHVQRLVNEKSAEGYAPRSVRYIHTTLLKALSQAVDWDLVPKNAASRVKLPRQTKTRRETLSVERVAAFFEAASSDRFEALYVLAVTAGMRPGELLGLKWEDLDLSRASLALRRTLSEDERGQPILKEETKAAGNRRIELVPVAVEALKRHRKRQNEERLRYAGAWEDHNLVFPSAKGLPMRRNNLHRRSYKPLLKAAGLPDIRLYDLRHTFATLMFESGGGLKLVSEMLGHSSIRQTADTYTHVTPTIHREAALRLNDFLSGHRSEPQ